MRRIAAGLLVGVLLGSTACAGAGLPGDAREALSSYWDSLPTDATIDYRITNAWRGGTVTETADANAVPAEIWCVETETSSASDPSLDGTRLVWIVSRAADEARWTTALLVTMSASWPYEACGPGSLDS